VEIFSQGTETQFFSYRYPPNASLVFILVLFYFSGDKYGLKFCKDFYYLDYLICASIS